MISACPSNLLVAAAGNSSLAVYYTVPTGTITCGTATTTCTVASGAVLSVSSSPYSVVCTLTDPNADVTTSSCPAFSITLDNQNPVIKCPSTISVSPSGGNTYVLVTANVNATDNIAVQNITCGAYTTVLTTGYYFPIGNTTLTCKAYDTAGNHKSCSFSVVNTASVPVITCPFNYTVTPTAGAPQVVLTSYNSTLTATDGSGIQSAYCTPAASTNTPVTFTLGKTPVNCYAYSNAGRSSNCTFYVNVVDTVPPAFTACPKNFTYFTSSSDGVPNPIVSFSSLVNATDGSGVMLLLCPASGSRFNVTKTSNVSCVAIDNAGNNNTCMFPLTVSNIVPPALVCPGNTTVTPTHGTPFETFSFSFNASDNCGIQSYGCNTSSTLNVTLGTTYVSCNATDYAGLHSSCLFSVNVSDTIKPSLTCPPYSVVAPLSLSPTNGNNPTAVANWVFSAGDGSGIAYSGCTNSSGSTFALGNYSILCSATDNAGNTASCPVFNVVVSDTAPPVIKCPGLRR